MHTANTTTLYSTVIQWKEAIKGKKRNATSKGGMCQPAPELSVRTCQLTVTARHVQYVKRSTRAAVAAHTRVLHGILVGLRVLMQRQ